MILIWGLVYVDKFYNKIIFCLLIEVVSVIVGLGWRVIWMIVLWWLFR